MPSVFIEFGALQVVEGWAYDVPAGKAGGVLTVEFTGLGMPFLGLNGGSHFKLNEAVSFQVHTRPALTKAIIA